MAENKRDTYIKPIPDIENIAYYKIAHDGKLYFCCDPFPAHMLRSCNRRCHMLQSPSCRKERSHWNRWSNYTDIDLSVFFFKVFTEKPPL